MTMKGGISIDRLVTIGLSQCKIISKKFTSNHFYSNWDGKSREGKDLPPLFKGIKGVKYIEVSAQKPIPK